MGYEQSGYKGMTLFTQRGERKYLSAAERCRFLDALPVLECEKDRTFAETLLWTGCRPSEALALRPCHIDLESAVIILRSLKKRGEEKGRHFRAVPVPRDYLERLDAAHRLGSSGHLTNTPLWSMGRTTAWKRIRVVMDEAGISGPMACAKGLRHTYGIHAAVNKVPETRIKKWLGHASLTTTEIYLDMAAPEDRAIARRMWDRRPANMDRDAQAAA